MADLILKKGTVAKPGFGFDSTIQRNGPGFGLPVITHKIVSRDEG
jgi:hypothetical protein